MKKMLVALLAALGLIATATPADATTYTYNQFSMMTGRNAGQYWQGGNAAGQWAWSPNPDGSSDVSWGNPAAWPPPTFEHFTHDGTWVYLEGYQDRTTGEFLRQVVTSESISDGNCAHMAPVPTPDGRQRYTKWTVSSTAYCLDTTGYLDYHGTRIDFRHTEVWFSPSGPTCSNNYYSGKNCIKQYEKYWDNNGAPGALVTLKVWRDNIFALGLGPAFIVHSYLPADNGWEAHLRYDWTY